MKNQFLAFFTLIGTIIGAGIFALPYVVFKVGIVLTFLYLVILGGVVAVLHILYAQIIVWTKDNHRLPGYVGIYFGEKGRKLTAIINILGLLGTLLIYLIIGSSFLNELLGGIFLKKEIFGILAFLAIASLLVLRGIKVISKFEALDLILLTLILLMIFKEGKVFFRTLNLLNFEIQSLFFPYGIILFSLWGLAAVPETLELLKNKEHLFSKIFGGSILILVLFYLLFAGLLAGIMGSLTPENALVGLKYFFDDKIVKVALLFGFIAVFTSFLTIGLNLEKVLWYDFKIEKKLAWFLAMFVPLGLYFLGLKSFINVIDTVGGIFLGLEGLIILALYLKAKNSQKIEGAIKIIEVPKIEILILAGFLILGILYQIQMKLGF